MNPSIKVDRRMAVFLAALPHRQSFYSEGGWARAPLPEGGDFRLFLNENFTRLEQDVAESVAVGLLSRAPACPGRPSRTGYVTWWDADYPLALRCIFDPPPVLFYALYGERFPSQEAVFEAIVGTRRPHRICQLAVSSWIDSLKKDALEYATPDLWIVSGLAFGVDRMAHERALSVGCGTIAVLGGGLSKAGPRSNLDLLNLAYQHESPLLLLTEFPDDTPGSRWSFPRRNRIIAGLARRTAVIQAPKRSGSMITARYALEEGREVAAFDHEILHFAGANEGARSLLEDGAQPVHFHTNLTQYSKKAL